MFIYLQQYYKLAYFGITLLSSTIYIPIMSDTQLLYITIFHLDLKHSRFSYFYNNFDFYNNSFSSHLCYNIQLSIISDPHQYFYTPLFYIPTDATAKLTGILHPYPYQIHSSKPHINYIIQISSHPIYYRILIWALNLTFSNLSSIQFNGKSKPNRRLAKDSDTEAVLRLERERLRAAEEERERVRRNQVSGGEMQQGGTEEELCERRREERRRD